MDEHDNFCMAYAWCDNLLPPASCLVGDPGHGLRQPCTNLEGYEGMHAIQADELIRKGHNLLDHGHQMIL